MTTKTFDAIVIGSGAGGLTAAARLCLAGMRPLVLEATARPGGRFSSIHKDGYVINTGAIAVESPGPWLQVMDDLGVDHDLRSPDVALAMRIGGIDFRAGSMTWEFLIKNVTKSAAAMAEAMRSATPSGSEQSLRDWALKFTKNETVLGFVDNLAQQVFIVNADEVSAGVFFQFIRRTGGYKSYGFAPRGNLEIVQKMIARMEELGAEVRLGWKVAHIEVEDGRASAVVARSPDGVEVRLPTRAVISNAGPVNTARMLEGTTAGAAFAQRVRNVRWASITSMAVASTKELIPNAAGMTGYVNAGSRLRISGNMTAVCPELAPPGMHLYYFMSIPTPSLGHTMDKELETRLLDADLRANFKDYAAHAQIIHVDHMFGLDVPGMHAGPSLGVPEQTPLPNVYDVGDGVAMQGAGTTSCAHSANRAVESLCRHEFNR